MRLTVRQRDGRTDRIVIARQFLQRVKNDKDDLISKASLIDYCLSAQILCGDKSSLQHAKSLQQQHQSNSETSSTTLAASAAVGAQRHDVTVHCAHPTASS